MPDSNESSRPKKRSGWATFRIGLAFVLAVVGFGLLFSTYIWDDKRVCRQEMSDAGTPHEVCGPAGASDLLVVGAGFFVIILLLWSEFSKISFPGFVTLKRRLNEEIQRTDRIEEKASRLELLVTQLQMTQNQNQNVTINTVDIDALLNRTKDKVEDIQIEPAPDAQPSRIRDDAIRKVSPERAQMEVQLLAVWEKLAALSNSVTGRGMAGSPPRSKPLAPWAQAWAQRFSREITELRIVRNTVVHRPDDLTDDEVRKALDTMKLVLGTVDIFRITYENPNNPAFYDPLDFPPGDPRHDS